MQRMIPIVLPIILPIVLPIILPIVLPIMRVQPSSFLHFGSKKYLTQFENYGSNGRRSTGRPRARCE